MADGFRAIDPYKDWKRMRRQATALFDAFGALRDCHVIMEWAQKLGLNPKLVHGHLATSDLEFFDHTWYGAK